VPAGTRESLPSSSPEPLKRVRESHSGTYDKIINHLLSAEHAIPIDHLLQSVEELLDLVHGLQQR
jgi:hypothetical protein